MRAEQIYDVVQDIMNKSKETDPFRIAESLGIFIRYDELGKLLGMYTIMQKCRFIIINKNLPYIWKRIVCAHELGHDTLHRHIAASRALQEFGYIDLTSKPEYEANIFAAELLVKDNDVISLIQEQRDFWHIAAELNIEPNFLALKFRNMSMRGIDLGCDIEPICNILGNVEVPIINEYEAI